MTSPKQARETLGLTQTQMAQVCNTTRDTISSWDQGRRNPSGPAARLLEIIGMLADDGLFEKYFDQFLKNNLPK